MMRLINGGLYLTAAASYLTNAALLVLGLLTILIALFRDNPTGQIGGLSVIVLALLLATATAIVMHFHRRDTR